MTALCQEAWKKVRSEKGEKGEKGEKAAEWLPFWILSGRLDSNQRPLAPHANALPGCATSRGLQLLNAQRFSIAGWQKYTKI